jgi:hypothetical protein
MIRDRNEQVRGRGELWELGRPAKQVGELTMPFIGRNPSASRSGRVLFHGEIGDDSVDLVDAFAGRIIYSHPSHEKRGPAPFTKGGPTPTVIKVVSPPRLSQSGRSLLTSDPATIWDFETSAPRWRGSNAWSVFYRGDDESFWVSEGVAWPLSIWGGSTQRYATASRRDFESGRTLCRCWATDMRGANWVSSDGQLAIKPDGTVHNLPYLINWPLLALCQGVLAIPLVLFWLALFWRRKRHLRRLAGATA